MKKYASVYSRSGSRGVQLSTCIPKAIREKANINKDDEVYFVYQNEVLTLQKQINKDLQSILTGGKERRVSELIYSRENKIVKKVIFSGKTQLNLTIPSFIAEKLNITKESKLVFNLDNDLITIEIL